MIEKLIPKTDKLKHSHLWTLAFFLANIVLIISITDVMANWVSTLLAIVVSDKDIALTLAYAATVFTAGRKEYNDYTDDNERTNYEFYDFVFSIMNPTLYVITYLISKIV